MHILQLDHGTPVSKATEICGEWNSQAGDGRLGGDDGAVTLFDSLTHDAITPRDGSKKGVLLARNDDGIFVGGLRYELLHPTCHEELGDMLQKRDCAASFVYDHGGVADRLTTRYLDGLRHYRFEQPLAYLDVLKSFQRGAGTALVTGAKDLPVTGICRFVNEHAVGFFQRVGFHAAGVVSYGGLKIVQRPLVVWMRSGSY